MKQFAIALNAGGPEQRNAITMAFSEMNWPYWHWVDDFWLVQTPDNYTSKSIHAKLESVSTVGTPIILIFEFKGRISYWGRASKNAWDWLSKIGSPG